MSVHYVWRRLSPTKWEDVWWDRLSEVGDRLAITALAGARTIRLEAFQLTRAQAEKLRRAFGGQVAVQKKLKTLPAPAPRAPIRVRGKLVVVATEPERALAQAKLGRAKLLLIPAGMAFGTGDHATTSTCLRLLADVSAELAGQPWELLDLGTGSGILALAARLFGARRVDAGDFDADSVRTTKANLRSNQLHGVIVKKMDVRQWQPTRTWPVVAANLFSGLLIETAPKIAAATAAGGRLIFSGILREQETAVVAAFEGAGFRIDRLIRKGKWVSGLATR
ncbi:MAG: ribosomal protein methyltransferase [Chthoniobacter sp.]|jgi:ribosomal protein L11 methyltransferase|nr:ribosomal protein methyltransferase [Chthoniobacter sp.]